MLSILRLHNKECSILATICSQIIKWAHDFQHIPCFFFPFLHLFYFLGCLFNLMKKTYIQHQVLAKSMARLCLYWKYKVFISLAMHLQLRHKNIGPQCILVGHLNCIVTLDKVQWSWSPLWYVLPINLCVRSNYKMYNYETDNPFSWFLRDFTNSPILTREMTAGLTKLS